MHTIQLFHQLEFTFNNGTMTYRLFPISDYTLIIKLLTKHMFNVILVTSEIFHKHAHLKTKAFSIFLKNNIYILRFIYK